MNHSKTLLRLAHATALCAALCAVLRSLSIALYFDRSVGYLARNPFSTLLYIVLALFAALCVFCAVKLKKGVDKSTPDLEAASTPARICALVSAVALAIAVVWECLGLHTADTLSLFRLLCALAAALYFGSRSNRRFAAFGLGAIGYGFASIAVEYFDWTTPMNSPLKILQSMALLAMMFFVLTEVSMRAQRPQSPARFAVVSAASALLGITNGVSMVTAAVAGDVIPAGYVVRALPTLAIGAYALARLYAVALAPAVPTPDAEQTTDGEAVAQADAIEELPIVDETVTEPSISEESLPDDTSEQLEEDPVTTTPEEQ